MDKNKLPIKLAKKKKLNIFTFFTVVKLPEVNQLYKDFLAIK